MGRWGWSFWGAVKNSIGIANEKPMSKLNSFVRAVFNPYNLLALPRTFAIIQNPIKFLGCFATGTYPKNVSVRTPCGIVGIRLRNYESLKTIFSIFVREDYSVSLTEQTFIDVGSNIGVSALYFLSRNHLNRIVCVEPDPDNNTVLNSNLSQFSGRYSIIPKACSAKSFEEITFYLSDDGKYNSMIKIPNAHSIITVKALPIAEIFNQANQVFPSNKLTMKIDIEGAEKEVLSAITDEHISRVERIYVEALDVGKCLTGNWREQIRAGYVTVLDREVGRSTE